MQEVVTTSYDCWCHVFLGNFEAFIAGGTSKIRNVGRASVTDHRAPTRETVKKLSSAPIRSPTQSKTLSLIGHPEHLCPVPAAPRHLLRPLGSGKV